MNKVQQIHGLPFFNGVICSLALASSLHKTENIFRECNICLYLLKRCHSKSSQVHVHFPDLMRFYFFTPKVSDRLRCDSLGNSYEKRHNEFTLTSINPWTSIPLNLLLTTIYVFISFSHSNHKSQKINLDPESMSRVSRITFRRNKNTGISSIEIVRDLIV